MFERIPGYASPIFNQVRRLEQELDELFGVGTTLTGTRDIRSLPAGTFPAVNVGSTPEAVSVYLFAPGIDPSKLDLSMQQNLLTVSGERPAVEEQDAKYYRRERFTGEFRRAISLPEDVDPDRVEARYSNGVLKVTLGRRAEAGPHRIPVQ